jgi:hypothetical protein
MKILLFPLFWLKVLFAVLKGAMKIDRDERQDYDTTMNLLGWKAKIGGFFSFWIFWIPIFVILHYFGLM